MIYSHSEAFDYVRGVLDYLGAGGPTGIEMEHKIGEPVALTSKVRPQANSPHGQFVFRSKVDQQYTVPDRELEWGRPDKDGVVCTVGYTLPVDPLDLRKDITLNFAPSSRSYLA